MSKKYKAPLGATSFTIDGETYEVDKHGILRCDDDSAHAALLSHGYTYGDDAPVFDNAADPLVLAFAERERQLVEREQLLLESQAKLNARTDDLIEREQLLAEQQKALSARDVDLAMRLHAIEQREAATPPPPPPPPADASAPPAPAGKRK